MVNVKGKWALVTGASRGLGFLAAAELAKRGCNLILQSRTVENSQKAAAELEKYGVQLAASLARKRLCVRCLMR